jgi:hypothetical protein
MGQSRKWLSVRLTSALPPRAELSRASDMSENGQIQTHAEENSRSTRQQRRTLAFEHHPMLEGWRQSPAKPLGIGVITEALAPSPPDNVRASCEPQAVICATVEGM